MEKDNIVRTFIAIELPVNIIDSLINIQNELKKACTVAAWIKPENIHLTIIFLGNIASDKINCIARMLEDLSGKSCCFDISIHGIGAFPTNDNPRVVWVGVEQIGTGLKPELLTLYSNLEQNLAALGFAKENRPFKPHLTLGRIKFLKDIKTLKQKIVELADKNFGKFTADRVSLFKSSLTPKGAVYTKLKEVRLVKY